MSAKVDIPYTMPIQDIMRLYSCSRASAYRARQRGHIYLDSAGGRTGRPQTRTIKGLGLSPDVVDKIAIRTARRYSKDRFMQDEIAQAVRIKLWITGADVEALAYTIAKNTAIDVFRKYRTLYKDISEYYDENEGYTDDDEEIE